MPTFNTRGEYERWKAEKIKQKTLSKADIKPEVTYYAVERGLSEKIRAIAIECGVTAEGLINIWVKEKVQEHKADN